MSLWCRTTRWRVAAVLGLALVGVGSSVAQDDRAAGLFTEATQLPLVAQSIDVRVARGEAIVDLDQVFANPGPRVAQADYRLHLPTGASVLGFSFWTAAGERVDARLREREEAVARHAAAVGAGRVSGLLQRHEGTIRSFSVVAVEGGREQRVRVRVRWPVVAEAGRSSLRLPLDRFLGHPRLESPVLVEVLSEEPLAGVGVDGGRFDVLSRNRRRARVALSSDEPVEVWWAEELPPVLLAADAVDLGDARFGLGLRIVAHDLPDVVEPVRRLVVLDASLSLRRRVTALETLLRRLEALPGVDVLAVTEEEVEALPRRADEATLLLRSRSFGSSVSWSDLAVGAASEGCGRSVVRCLIVTDPQVAGLPAPEERHTPAEVLFLADAEEGAHFADRLGPDARVFDVDGDPRARLRGLVDEALLPTLEVRQVDQRGGTHELQSHDPLRVAEGGALRAVFTSSSTAPLGLELVGPGGTPERRTVEVRVLDPEGPAGRVLRREVVATLLERWAEEYRRSRDPALRQRIVDTSLAEGLPTEWTALQVDAAASGALPKTGTVAPVLRWLGLLALLVAGALAASDRRRRVVS